MTGSKSRLWTRPTHTLTASLLLYGIACQTVPAQIVPSGSTATSVSTAVGGKQTVSIAPALPGGLSYNSYNAFSVGRPGAELDNRLAGARTIVNEVVTTNRSVLQGPIEVLGGRAHVLIVNPNGITVDGATFINTGGVVLGAGTIDLQTRSPAPFISQTNAVLNTSSSADIFIGAGGLGGTMASLQLYAGTIRVDGLVQVSPETASRPAGDLRLLAGKSSIEFDAAVLPIAALGNWATVTSRGTGSGEVLVDITSRGSLEASRVVVGVTGNGAGVSYAGKGLATAGDFKIDGSGLLTLTGAEITAAANVKAKSAEITILNAPERQSKVVAVGGALTLIASGGDLRNIGGLLQGEKRDATDTDSRGAVTVSATGNVDFRSDSPARLAIAFANSDDLVVTASNRISNTAGRFLSNQQTLLTAGTDIVNQVEVIGGSAPARAVTSTFTSGSRPWWQRFWGHRRISGASIDWGNLAIPGQIAFIVGSGVVLSAGGNVVNRGGEIDANNGGVTIRGKALINEGVVTGQATLTQSCWVWCRSNGASDITVNGGRINASGSIDVVVPGAVTNIGGQWLALGGINVDAASLRAEGVLVTSIVTRPGGLRQLFDARTAWSVAQDVGGVFLALGGTSTIKTTAPVEIAGGQISAPRLSVPAGITVLYQPMRISPIPEHRIGGPLATEIYVNVRVKTF